MCSCCKNQPPNFSRYSLIARAAVAPSPAAEAACLVDPARTSPAAKMPGREVIIFGLDRPIHYSPAKNYDSALKPYLQCRQYRNGAPVDLPGPGDQGPLPLDWVLESFWRSCSVSRSTLREDYRFRVVFNDYISG